MGILTGKIALVTGASQGIGRGIAVRLGRDGAKVAINYVGNAEAASEAVHLVKAAGGEATAFQADISQPDAIAALFQSVLKAFGRIDILVNNAGVATLLPLREITEAEYNRVFGLNAKGTLFCLHQAALHLADSGRVVNIASSTADFPTEGASIYAGSKSAVKAYTKVAAIELGTRGITVNTVTPGVTETPLSSKLPDSFKQPVIESSPFKRLGKPDDIADVVAFLVSDDARWVTGQDILVNGGAKQ